MDDLTAGALLLALIVLLVVSGFFAIAETSMMALNRYRLNPLMEAGHRGAQLAHLLLQRTDRLLGVILIGKKLANAAAATLAAVVTVHFFGHDKLAVAAGTAVITFLIVVFAEITPRVIGASYPERVALPVAFLLAPLLRVAFPLVWFTDLCVRVLLRMLRLGEKVRRPEPHLSLPELRTLVLEARHYIPRKHQSILLNLIELEAITVDDVMTPRTQIEALDADEPIAGLQRRIATCYHTRLPVYRGQLDEIVGILHVRSFLSLGRRSETMKAEDLLGVLREPYYIPAGTPLLTQLQHFQENNDRLGLVVDEYGELKGLLTIDDILEEIIGEFTTHSPLDSPAVHPQPDGSTLVEGSLPLRELNRRLGIHFPLDGPKTLNGLILERLQDIPQPGTTIVVDDHAIEIVQTQEKVVRAVRIYPRTKENDALIKTPKS